MKRYLKYISSLLISGETGQALILILVFVLLGSLTVLPTLAHMSTALKTGVAYENKTNEFFTADAGIENGLWRIKYDLLGPTYSIYDYDTVWSYETDPVNNREAAVTVENVWLPTNVTLDSLGITPEEAATMVESEKLLVTGTSGASPSLPYHIKIQFTPGAGDNLTIKSIGVWLPQGFKYSGNCLLEAGSIWDEYYPDDVSTDDAPGGESTVWSYDSPYPLFTDFPDCVSENGTYTCTITFEYDPPADNPDKVPLAVAWVTTDGAPDFPIAWDTDARFYRITSVTGKTQIETYSSKSQLRKLGNAIAGDYVAIGNSLLADDNHDNYRETWHTPSHYTVTVIPDDADVIAAYLYWAGWRQESIKVNLFNDACDNLTNWTMYSDNESQTRVPTGDGDILGTWNTSPRWDDVDETTPNDTDYMTGTTLSGGSAYQLFTFSPFTIPADASITNLTIYFRVRDTNGTNNIRASIKVNGNLYNTTATSVNPGTSFTTYSYSFLTNPDNAGADWTYQEINGGGDHPLQQFGLYSTDLDPDIQVSMIYAEAHYSCWTYSNNRIQANTTTSFSGPQRTLTMKNSLDLSAYTHSTVAVYWEQTVSATLESSDALYFDFSGDGGVTWSDMFEYEAFSDDSPTPESPFWFPVPDDYLTSQFKIRFYLNFNDSAEYVYLDDIKVIYMTPDTSITFKINDEQVYFDGSEPASGSQPLTASRSYARFNILSGSPAGYSYACVRDVSKLVKKYPVVPGEEHHTGNTKYTVDGVSAETGAHFSFAGWSLIIIYGSPATAGHYLYLCDDTFAYHSGTGEDLDFDDDGNPGGEITGFVIPEPIRDKNGTIVNNIAASLTCFIVEGDLAWTPDSIEVTGQQSAASKYLSNIQSPLNNAWNGLWPSEVGNTVYEGIDVDTYQILWTDNILMPKDNMLTVDMVSNQDSFNIVYFIISVCCETVTGGTENYVIMGIQ